MARELQQSIAEVVSRADYRYAMEQARARNGCAGIVMVAAFRLLERFGLVELPERHEEETTGWIYCPREEKWAAAGLGHVRLKVLEAHFEMMVNGVRYETDGEELRLASRPTGVMRWTEEGERMASEMFLEAEEVAERAFLRDKDVLRALLEIERWN